jgi:hypothetical protein
MIERVSGDVLINTTIEHPDGIDHNDLKHPFNEWMSKSQASAVYSFRHLVDEQLNVWMCIKPHPDSNKPG